MPIQLFVYGTLRDPDLLAGVLGRSIRPAAALPAAAPGFVAIPYPGRIYPALVRQPGGAAAGLLLTDLSPFERDLLDAYEGDEYRRAVIPVMVAEELHEAFAYLPTMEIARGGAAPWRLAHWQEEHKRRVLPGEQIAAKALRTRLIAIRPH